MNNSCRTRLVIGLALSAGLLIANATLVINGSMQAVYEPMHKQLVQLKTTPAVSHPAKNDILIAQR